MVKVAVSTENGFVAEHFGYVDFAPDAGLMALVAAVVNIILRFMTKTPVKILPVE